MSYVGLLFIVIVIILTIVIAILFTIGIDDLARLSDTTDVVNNRIINTVISIGTFVVIFIIFLLAVELTLGILIYYNASRNRSSNFVLYGTIVLIISIIGLIFLEIYTYRELSLFKENENNPTVTNSINNFYWSIILTVVLFLMSLILVFTI